MSDALHVVCPHCNRVNRVPTNRLGAGGKCGRCHEALFEGHPLTLTQANFAQHLGRSDLPLLVDFWAPWCGPCRMMAPIFEQAARQLEPRVRLAKLNTEEEQGLAAQYSIRSIPSLVFFSGGREVARQAGAMDLQSLLTWTRQHL